MALTIPAPEATTLPAGESAALDLPPIPKEALAALARLRDEAAAEVERLLAFLDATEPDPDLEEGDEGGGDINDEPHDGDFDSEPSLAFPGAASGTGGTQHHGNASDLEDDNDSGIADDGGLAEQTTGEPTLGSFDRLMNQQHGWQQRFGPGTWHAGPDTELDDADKEDNGDLEPSLGSLEQIASSFEYHHNPGGNQAIWAAGSTDDREHDPAEGGEPEDWE
jgi:hypothetical protein